jgi:protein-S-isoprenylcysteine O-methyltransferase Ste14
MKRIAFFAYGVACHALFLATFAYLAGFVGNFAVPNSIDSGAPGSLTAAVAVDLVLMAVFALQHSVMARPAFKRVWTRFIPQPIERSTYVLVSCLVTWLLIWQWQPIPIVVWDAPPGALRMTLTALFAAGWLTVPVVSLMINHFDLFGTRQVWLYLRGRPYTHLPFRTPLLYKWVRHPLYVGWALAFWATPTMTAGHLLFAGVLTLYMAVASRIEERDLVAHFGRQYEDYRRRVGAFLPALRRAKRSADEAAIQPSPSSV